MNEPKFWTWYKNQLKCLPKNLWKRLAWRPDAYDEEAIAFFVGLFTTIISYVLLCDYNLMMPNVQGVVISLALAFFWLTVWYHSKYRQEG